MSESGVANVTSVSNYVSSRTSVSNRTIFGATRQRDQSRE